MHLDATGLLASASYASGTAAGWFVCGFMYGFTVADESRGPNIQDLGQRSAFLDGLCSAGHLMMQRHLEVAAN